MVSSSTIYQKMVVVMKNSKRYELDPIILSRLGVVESSFNHTKKNAKGDCLGLYQINYAIHREKLSSVKCEALSIVYESDKKCLRKYLLRIGYNTTVACIILRNYMKSQGNIERSLLKFGGWRSKKGKKNPKGAYTYLSKVLGESK